MGNNYYSKYAPRILFHHLLNKYFMPFKSKQVQLSAIASPIDEVSTTTKYLFDLALDAAKAGYDLDLSMIEERGTAEFKYVNIYPGEHYKLLAGLMKVIQPKVVIEIGTFLGQSALTMKAFMPKESTLYTFDIHPWHRFDATYLKESDFEEGQLVQHLDDLTKIENFQKHKDIIENADFIFIDAMKDGVQELEFLNNMETMRLKPNCIIMFDDIRVWNMVKIWRNIKQPKLDITSLGHWSGTGLIHWNG